MSENESMINEFFAESMEMIQRLGQNFGKLEKNVEIKLKGGANKTVLSRLIKKIER